MTRFPEPHFVETNGIRMAVYEEGPKDAPAVVMCHGWPELGFSWRHQLPALAAAGYRAIAPDQRGYGRTDAPQPVSDYSVRHLCADLTGMLDALGIEKAVFAGHDWGGLVVWDLPRLHPERVAGVIGVNTPFLPRIDIDPIDFMRSFRGEKNYIVQFQDEGKAEAILEKDVEGVFRFLMRRGDMTPEEFEAQPSELKNLDLLGVFQMGETIWGDRDTFLSEEELRVFVESFERTGFRGGINWYRNMSRNWRENAELPNRIDHPALMIMADKDVVLPPKLADGMEAYVPDLEKVLVTDSGHWTQQEQPEQVNEAMIRWLKKRFPV